MPAAYVTGSAETGEKRGGRGGEKEEERETGRERMRETIPQLSHTVYVCTVQYHEMTAPNQHYMCSKKYPDLQDNGQLLRRMLHTRTVYKPHLKRSQLLRKELAWLEEGKNVT